jgi:hypothetical protein
MAKRGKESPSVADVLGAARWINSFNGGERNDVGDEMREEEPFPWLHHRKAMGRAGGGKP